MRLTSRVGKRGGLARLLALAAMAVLIAVLAAACGSGDDGTASSGGAETEASEGAETEASEGAAGSEQEEVFALAEELLERPTEIPVTEPVGEAIPSGKRIIWINCGAPVCTILGENFKEGAEELGWTTELVNTDGTPASVQKAWKDAVNSAPDAVASSGSDTSVIGKQLKELKAKEIPVANYSVPETADGITYLLGDGPEIGEAFGEPQAAFISQHSEGDANTLYVTLPEFAILPFETEYFTQTYEKGCPDCEMEELDLPISSFGKDAPQRIVSALRANPDVEYVALAVDDLAVGLPAALQAAGLSDVQIVGASSTATNFQYIASGEELAGVPNDIPGLTWQMVDALARIFTGQSTEPDEVPNARMIVTKENLPSSDEVFPFVEDYKEQFRALWGL